MFMFWNKILGIAFNNKTNNNNTKRKFIKRKNLPEEPLNVLQRQKEHGKFPGKLKLNKILTYTCTDTQQISGGSEGWDLSSL